MMIKTKQVYTKLMLKRALAKIPNEKLDDLYWSIRAGCTVVEITKKFNISEHHATVLFLEYSVVQKKYQKLLGTKAEPYYAKEEDCLIPEYSADDLKGEELLIYKSITMGRMKELYIELMNKYEDIPEDFNLTEYLYKKDLENGEWKEHEKKLTRAKKEKENNIISEERNSE